jgi:hypothetical protein
VRRKVMADDPHPRRGKYPEFTDLVGPLPAGRYLTYEYRDPDGSLIRVSHWTGSVCEARVRGTLCGVNMNGGLLD